MQQLRVILLGEPSGTPRLRNTQPESVRMNFLTHYLFLFRSGALAQFHDDMSHPALIPIGTAHRSRPDPFGPRAFVDVRFRDKQPIHVDFPRLVLGVCNGRPQHLLNRRRNPLIDRAENGDRLPGLTAADHVDDQPGLLRRHTDVSCFSLGQNRCLISHAYRAPFSVDFATWPLKIRVGENSPNLWPTMFSVTYTGMNFFPLWTAKVWPIKSGTIVERRDQVRTTAF